MHCSAFAILMGQSFYFSLGLFAIPALIVFAIPLVSLFISTSRMRREAESQSAGDDLSLDDFFA
jgi:hypothetical protein